ncbi:MAG: SDR family oxidoreductase [Acetobacteraceae bacterium]
MDLGIAGRTALVSGASRGMGRATALQLAREGVHLVMVARQRERLEQAAAAIAAETGVRTVPIAADITTEVGRAAALSACPAPDILITNADGPRPGDFRDWTREDWIEAVDALMLTPIALIRATVDAMIARRFGRIVNISARGVKIAQPELGLSNGSRSGLVGFVAGLSRQIVRHNVTINTLLPGVFDTDAQRTHVAKLAAQTGRPEAELWEERTRANPAGRMGDAAEFAAYCAFLCSAQAGYITGQNLLIDGGSYPGTF